MTPTRDLADALAQRMLDADPFLGSFLGLRDYDGRLPDVSAAAEQAMAAEIAAIAERAAALEPDSVDDRITLQVLRTTCERYLDRLEVAAATYTVTALPMSGPPALFAVAARTVLPDARAAADYLSRLSAAATWIDQICQRLREGRDAGLMPVGSLVDQAIAWADHTLAEEVPPALAAAAAPADWDDAPTWRSERDALVTGSVRPALARWRDLLVELRPACRDDEHVGIAALPGGDELYRRCIAVHTTLDLTADELHETGLAAVAELEARAVELGAQLGLADLDEVIAAVRDAAARARPQEAILAAREAVARAEARAAEIMPDPLPAPCAVEPMPQTVAESGMAPHYTRPRDDAGRPGTFWFNTMRPTAGTGWDLEAVAFHEAVPGHHSQLARLGLLTELPLLHQFTVTVHAEGWGLYAERLADEFGLYSDVRALLGAVYIEMHRAVRLVVDTGMHHRGWSRRQAVDYMVEHVALPEQFLADEIDRYIVWPGQALAYLTGQREILRLRADAEKRLGSRFDLPGFHSALLDRGSLPMPVLADAVDVWIEAVLKS